MTKTAKRGRPLKEPVPPQRQTRKHSITVGYGETVASIFAKVLVEGGDPDKATFEKDYGYYDEVDLIVNFEALESEAVFEHRTARYQKELEKYNKKKAKQ